MKTVLLVEDLRTSAAIIAQKIRNIGGEWGIVIVHDLAGALKELRAKKFDLIVLDIGLPDSGWESTVRRVKPHAKNTPIIVLTVLDDPRVRETVQDDGVSAFLVKGEFADQEFSETVKSAVGFTQESVMEKITKDDDAQQEIEVSNPILGRLSARGVRTSDLIGLLTLCLVGVVLFLVLRSHDSAAIQRDTTAKRYGELGAILKNQVASQKLMTCIISVPQERREQEYSQPNSFCRRMAEGQ